LKNNMRVLLFALTGFGNKVIDALLAEDCELKYLYTRPEAGPFPFYEEKNISQYAEELGIKAVDDFNWEDVKKVISGYSPELLLVASFHRVIPEEIIKLVPFCVNFHPSLLPKYRGPTPIDWVIFNKEKKTGITAHWLTKGLDEGDILIQNELLIEEGETKNGLFEKLAILAAKTSRQTVRKLKSGNTSATPQDASQATYQPRFDANQIK